MQQSPKERVSRRVFLARSAAASLLAGSWIIPASVRGGEGGAAPSERINVGLIGFGVAGAFFHAPLILAEPRMRLTATPFCFRMSDDTQNRQQ